MHPMSKLQMLMSQSGGLAEEPTTGTITDVNGIGEQMSVMRDTAYGGMVEPVPSAAQVAERS